MIDLSGKVALLSGAGRGIGRGCAEELARYGAHVLINDRPGSPDLPQAVESIQKAGGTASELPADVFSVEGCQQLVAEATALAGRIDILVSNPAYSRRGAFLEYSPEEFEKTLRGTLMSGFVMSQAVARQMVEQGDGGKIVFISSVHAEMPIALSCAYGAAKAGLNHLAQTIAVELAPHRINVNVIEPGWIDTPGERITFSEETIQTAAKKLPWGRIGTPADIGQAVAFLVSDAADYITGAVLPVDGNFRFKDCAAEKTPPLKASAES